MAGEQNTSLGSSAEIWFSHSVARLECNRAQVSGAVFLKHLHVPFKHEKKDCSSFPKKYVKVGEMVLLVKCLPHEHEVGHESDPHRESRCGGPSF